MHYDAGFPGDDEWITAPQIATTPPKRTYRDKLIVRIEKQMMRNLKIIEQGDEMIESPLDEAQYRAAVKELRLLAEVLDMLR